jgi:CxC5 like cysteine cluster associated with KDZ transposases
MLLPVVAALPQESQFPEIYFQDCSQFILKNFSSKITLSQVLLVLFTITDNPDLLSLHARQQNPQYEGEIRSSNSGWIKSLARVLQEKLGDNSARLFKQQEMNNMVQQEIVNKIGGKLDALAKLLLLYPYNSQGQFQGKLQPVSYKSIQAVQVICPHTVVCETLSCKPRSLLQNTRLRDIPRVTLIKGSTIFENVQVLTGYCPTCQTTYLADHERVVQADNKHTKVYLNAAKYLKVGQSLWVDRIFSNAVLNSMYSFHASASTFMEFWNNSFHPEHAKKITRRQIWQAFVQESICSIAAASNINVELQDKLAIDDVTKEAFSLLGENGIICAVDQHACKECTQPYKQTADILSEIDSAAVVGVDENRTVPGLAEEVDQSNVETATQSNENAVQAQNTVSDDNDMDIDQAVVTMAVVDGIVFGPLVCVGLISLG